MTQDDSAGDNSVPQETELAGERGAALAGGISLYGRCQCSPRSVQLCWASLHGRSFGNWQCHSRALSLSLGFCSAAPPSLLPGRGDLGLAQHQRLQILHHQHPQLVPSTSCPGSEALTGSETLLACSSFRVPLWPDLGFLNSYGPKSGPGSSFVAHTMSLRAA